MIRVVYKHRECVVSNETQVDSKNVSGILYWEHEKCQTALNRTDGQTVSNIGTY